MITSQPTPTPSLPLKKKKKRRKKSRPPPKKGRRGGGERNPHQDRPVAYTVAELRENGMENEITNNILTGVHLISHSHSCNGLKPWIPMDSNSMGHPKTGPSSTSIFYWLSHLICVLRPEPKEKRRKKKEKSINNRF